MLLVVACPGCGFAKICAEGTATARCSHCSKSIRLDRAVIHYSGTDREKATGAVFRINAHVEGLSGARKKIAAGSRPGAPVKAAPRPQRRQSIDVFLSHRSSFSAAELIEALGIDAGKADELIAKMLERGVIMMRGAGNYAVVS